MTPFWRVEAGGSEARWRPRLGHKMVGFCLSLSLLNYATGDSHHEDTEAILVEAHVERNWGLPPVASATSPDSEWATLQVTSHPRWIFMKRSPSWHLDCSPMKALSQHCPNKPLLKSWPTSTMGDDKCSLLFWAICYREWGTNRVSLHRALLDAAPWLDFFSSWYFPIFLWECFLMNPSHKNPCLGIRFILYKKVKSPHKIILIQDSQFKFSSTAKESFLIWFYSFSITAILTSFLHPLDHFDIPSSAHGPQEGR